MPIISVRDNENKRWKRKARNKDRKEKGLTQAMVKVWELNGLVSCFGFFSFNM